VRPDLVEAEVEEARSGGGVTARSGDTGYALGGSSNHNCGARRAGPTTLAISAHSGSSASPRSRPVRSRLWAFILFLFSLLIYRGRQSACLHGLPINGDHRLEVVAMCASIHYYTKLLSRRVK